MSLDDGIDQLLYGTQRRTTDAPVTGQVVKVTTDGTWVAPLGTKTDSPIGPCRGPATVTVGSVVLLVFTDDGPWVAQIAGGS